MLDEYASIMQNMRILTFVAVLLLFGLIAFEYINNQETVSLCNAWAFIASSGLNLIINILFMLQCRSIAKIFEQIKERQL